MNKHHLDSFIERETKLIEDIEDYLEDLVKGEYEHFSTEKLKNKEYSLDFEFGTGLEVSTAIIHSIDIIVTAIEIYEKALKMRYDSLEEIIEAYISERLVEEIKEIIREAAEDIPEGEENEVYPIR